MRTELISQEKNRIEIKAEFEASEFETELNKVFNSISMKAKIPGFRKGHVPRKTIEMRFGKNAIHDEVIENLLNENIPEIIKDYDIEPISPPSLKSRSAIIDGQSVSVNLLIEAKPEIKLPVLEDIEVERLITIVDSSMVNDMIEKLRKSQAKIEAVNAPIQDDSIVSVEFSVVTTGEDGEELSRSKKNEMATLDMQELPAAEFKEPLLGKSAGDLTDVVMQIPMNVDNTNLPRTTTRYEIKIVEVGKRILPELEPDFFKLCMGFECPTIEDFRTSIEERILVKLQNEVNADAEMRAVNIVAEASDFEVPSSLIYQEIKRIRDFDERDAKEKYNMEFKDFLKARKIEYEAYEKQTIARAWRIIRDSLVIDEIRRKYEISIEPTDLDEWIKNAAERDGVDVELLKKVYYKDKDTVNILVDRVYAAKAIKLIMDKVKIIDVSELSKPVVNETVEIQNAGIASEHMNPEIPLIHESS